VREAKVASGSGKSWTGSAASADEGAGVLRRRGVRHALPEDAFAVFERPGGSVWCGAVHGEDATGTARGASTPPRPENAFPTLSHNFGKSRSARRIRIARAGLERPRQAAAVPIPPCVKLIQSSALEAAISIKITYGGIDSATCARRGMIHTVCAFVFAAASKSSSESEAGCRWRLSQYRDRIPASSSLAGTPDLTKRIASGFP